MSVKQFLMKQAAKWGTRNMPEAEQKMIMGIIEKNPDLFEKIAKEIEELKKTGKPEMYASFEVMKKYQKELQDTFAGEDPSKLQALAKSMM